MTEDAPIRDEDWQRKRRFIASLPLFVSLPDKTLDDIADQAQQIILPGGERLFAQHDPSDAFYVLRWGRLAAWRRRKDGRRRLLGQIAPGGYVGETGLILEQPRSASIVALRDSELLCWSKETFETLVSQYPSAMLRVSREALRRFASTVNRPSGARCFALLPGTPGVDLHDFARRLQQVLGHLGEVGIVHSAEAEHHALRWFSELEQRMGGLIYVADADAQWRQRCIRQSDLVLVVTDTRNDPAAALRLPTPVSEHVPVHLVLLQHQNPEAGSTRPWLATLPRADMHHHVRNQKDLARVARLVTGHALGLVLSGGGARGFAHIGVLRALRERGLEVDYVAGCSAGALIGAGIAADWADSHLAAALRAAFVDDNPLSDFTLPLVAIHSGRKASRLLRRTFGSLDIEDLPLPFFCVSADLTEGELFVHDRGRLWLALRATTALPGVVPPLFHQRKVLVDGGVIDSLPVSEMRSRLAGRILAVDVGGNYRIDTTLEEHALPSWWRQILAQWRERRYPSIARILWRSVMVNSDANAARQRKHSSLLLKPDLTDIDLFAWQQFDHIIELGYEYACQHLEALENAETEE